MKNVNAYFDGSCTLWIFVINHKPTRNSCLWWSVARLHCTCLHHLLDYMNAVRDSSVLDNVLIHSASALRYTCTQWGLWTVIDTVVPLAEEAGLWVHYNFPPVKQGFIIDDVHNPSWLCYNMMLWIALRTRGITLGKKTSDTKWF